MRAGKSSLKRSSEPRSRRIQDIRLKAESLLWRSGSPKHENLQAPVWERLQLTMETASCLAGQDAPPASHRLRRQPGPASRRLPQLRTVMGDKREASLLQQYLTSSSIERPSRSWIQSPTRWGRIFWLVNCDGQNNASTHYFVILVCKARGWLFPGAFPATRIKPLDI